MPTNGWNEYKKLILNKMKEDEQRFTHISTSLIDILKGQTDLRIEVERLKVKATIMGGIAGIVSTAIVTAILNVWK